MKIEYKELDKLKPYKNNAKKHPKSQIKKISESIEQFGFRNPVLVDENNIIVAGHGRYEAAKRLKLVSVPTISVNDLSKEQIKAYRIMDNKSTESDWDYDFLSKEFSDLNSSGFDLNFTGFDFEERKDIIGENQKDKTESVNKVGSLHITCPRCGHTFKKKDIHKNKQ